MTKVYSYTRFSTPEQAAGDSFRRQTEAARKWAEARGLVLDVKLSFADDGVSAYRGGNVDTDRGLGAFLFACQQGLVERGSYLLVESLDRISRMSPRKAQRLLDDIVDSGITVVTLNDGQEYTAERLDSERDTARINAALRSLFDNVVIDYRGGHLRFQWKQGGEASLMYAWPEGA
ncbi:MAG: recombinase family protein [Erythrobacter sp.]|nr:recombinase family protein [Erythrobacter sp.]